MQEALSYQENETLPQFGRRRIAPSVQSPVLSLVPSKTETIDQLRAQYAFQDAAAISDFLCGKPNIIPVLNEALVPIRTIFGQSTKPSLRLSYDRDSDVDSRYLLVEIPSSNPLMESIALLDRFEDEWWIAQPIAEDGLLVFDVDAIG